MATQATRPDWVLETDNADLGTAIDADLAAGIDQLMKDRAAALKFQPGTFDQGRTALYNPGEEGAPSDAASQVAPTTAPPVPGSDQTAQPVSDPASGDGLAHRPAGGDTADNITPGDALPPPAPDAPQSTPELFNVVLPTGDRFAMNNEQANYLLQLNNWLENTPPEVKQQWASIEQGVAVAVPASEYEALKAEVARFKAATPTPASAVQRPADYNPNLVDSSTADYIARLEALAASTSTTPVTTTQTDTPSQQPVQQLTQADIDRQVQVETARRINTTNALDEATAKIAEQYGLSQEHIAQLQRVTPALNIIPQIAESRRQYSPTGQLISEAPLVEVFTQAFETAMSMDATLRTVKDNFNVQQYLAKNNSIIANTNAKKANAGSLATAPSAAVPGREVDMSKMSKGQRESYAREQMAAEIAQAMADHQ